MADRYLLYAQAVQSPDLEVEFFRRLYAARNGRGPRIMREDFCGTAAICCHWVQTGRDHQAIGVDLDPEPLAWAREYYLPALKPHQAERIDLRRANVLTVRTPPVDVICALNFSFCVFKERKVLLRYLRRCRRAMKRGGILVMDTYGGPKSIRRGRERTARKGFTFVWDQAAFNPITSEALNHIHFVFPDGSRMNKAFTYDWRLWTPIELTEAMREAGFRDARVYWEEDEDEDESVFQHRRQAEPEDAWVCYVVGFA